MSLVKDLLLYHNSENQIYLPKVASDNPMNILRAAADEGIKTQVFSSPGSEPSYYTAVQISGSSSTSAEHCISELETDAIRDFIHAAPPTSSDFFLRLVCFKSPSGRLIDTSRNIYLQVHKAFQLEDYGNYLITKRAYGFHRFRPQGSRIGFFLGLSGSKILYTYDAASHSTSGIIIQDTPSWENPLELLPSLLCQAANLAPHPYFLPCICAVRYMTWTRAGLRNVLVGIFVLGKEKGFDIWSESLASYDMEAADKLATLSHMADLMGPMIAELDEIRRLMVAADSLREGMEDEKTRVLLHDIEDSVVVRGTVEEVNEVVRLAFQQIDSDKAIAGYWLERGKTQMTMILNMITRGDALASIQLARTATRDSSSMKSIAVMTMVFLPATFLAALFSIPSLDWEGDDIVSDRFWIYWAFTLPCTLLVFLVWFILTSRKEVSEFMGLNKMFAIGGTAKS